MPKTRPVSYKTDMVAVGSAEGRHPARYRQHLIPRPAFFRSLGFSVHPSITSRLIDRKAIGVPTFLPNCAKRCRATSFPRRQNGYSVSPRVVA